MALPQHIDFIFESVLLGLICDRTVTYQIGIIEEVKSTLNSGMLASV